MNYLKLIKLAFFKPQDYLKKIYPFKRLKQALFFFSLNVIFGSLVGWTVEIAFKRNLALVFLAISETILLLIFSFFLLLLLSAFYYGLAKILEGQGDFRSTIKSLAFASAPLVIFWLPYLRLISLALIAYLLVLLFEKVHQYSKAKAVLNALIPILVIILSLFSLSIYQ